MQVLMIDPWKAVASREEDVGVICGQFGMHNVAPQLRPRALPLDMRTAPSTDEISQGGASEDGAIGPVGSGFHLASIAL
jgi:hypothetical protein